MKKTIWLWALVLPLLFGLSSCGSKGLEPGKSYTFKHSHEFEMGETYEESTTLNLTIHEDGTVSGETIFEDNMPKFTTGKPSKITNRTEGTWKKESIHDKSYTVLTLAWPDNHAVRAPFMTIDQKSNIVVLEKLYVDDELNVYAENPENNIGKFEKN